MILQTQYIYLTIILAKMQGVTEPRRSGSEMANIRLLRRAAPLLDLTLTFCHLM